jgi:hypothetical protein
MRDRGAHSAQSDLTLGADILIATAELAAFGAAPSRWDLDRRLWIADLHGQQRRATSFAEARGYHPRVSPEA